MESSIINLTKPVLYETGYDEWPYAYSGSCYPVRWKKNLYIISAHHCYKNHNVKPEKTLYPIPDSAPLQFYGFNSKLTAQIENKKYKDQVILVVSKKLHTQKIVDLTKAIDLSDNMNIVSLSESKIKNIFLRGYLLDNPSHKIDYDNKKIKPQAFIATGIRSLRKSSFDFCHFLKVKTPFPENMSPNGMSGSPVYGINQQGTLGLSGTIIEFNSYTNEFLVIDSLVLRDLLKGENA